MITLWVPSTTHMIESYFFLLTNFSFFLSSISLFFIFDAFPSNIKIGGVKLRFDNVKKNLTNNLNVNRASETLKLNKYDENVREYLETFFYLFIIYLTSKFISK